MLTIQMTSSGQSAYPNRLDSSSLDASSPMSSGQSAYPNRLDSKLAKSLLKKGFLGFGVEKIIRFTQIDQTDQAFFLAVLFDDQ